MVHSELNWCTFVVSFLPFVWCQVFDSIALVHYTAACPDSSLFLLFLMHFWRRTNRLFFLDVLMLCFLIMLIHALQVVVESSSHVQPINTLFLGLTKLSKQLSNKVYVTKDFCFSSVLQSLQHTTKREPCHCRFTPGSMNVQPVNSADLRDWLLLGVSERLGKLMYIALLEMNVCICILHTSCVFAAYWVKTQKPIRYLLMWMSRPPY